MKSIYVFLLVLLALGDLSAQQIKGMGLSYAVGVSSGDSDNTITKDVSISSSIGLYKLFNLHKDTSNRMINYIKVDLRPFAYRYGQFEINGNGVRIKTSTIDLAVVIPVRFGVSNKVDVFVGAGPVVSYLLDQNLKWSGVTEVVKEEKAQFGLVGEIGFLTQGSTQFGIRTFQSYSEYPVTEISVFCGIGFMDMYNSRKRK